jgi:hypothetical protein
MNDEGKDTTPGEIGPQEPSYAVLEASLREAQAANAELVATLRAAALVIGTMGRLR